MAEVYTRAKTYSNRVRNGSILFLKVLGVPDSCHQRWNIKSQYVERLFVSVGVDRYLVWVNIPRVKEFGWRSPHVSRG